MAVDEETLQEHLNDPEARAAWRIPNARNYAKISAVVQFIALVAMVGVLIAYFITGDPEMVNNRISGLIIVVVMVFAIAVLRIFQLRAELADIPAFKSELARRLDGRDEHDVQAQMAVEDTYVWPSRHYSVIAKMAGFTAFAVLVINTYQIGNLDLMRTIVFDLGIVAYLAGSLWNNFTFKAELLSAELEERMRASLNFREAYPEEYAAQYKDDEDNYTDDQIDYSAAPKSLDEGSGQDEEN